VRQVRDPAVLVIQEPVPAVEPLPFERGERIVDSERQHVPSRWPGRGSSAGAQEDEDRSVDGGSLRAQ
jgi:hypothetical protein